MNFNHIYAKNHLVMYLHTYTKEFKIVAWLKIKNFILYKIVKMKVFTRSFQF